MTTDSQDHKDDKPPTVSESPPRLFVSYTHETPEHKRWVGRLAQDMRAKGVDVILDQWDVQIGSDLTLFMETGIRTADRVLLVCTPTYKTKADEGTGGVGYERMVVTGEIAKKIDTTKFFCVLRTGTSDESVPVFAATRMYVDFTDDSTYEVSLEDLLRDIHDAPKMPKPPVGGNPFVDQPFSAVVDAKTALPSISPAGNTEELYARANRILRSNDIAGWKRFMRELRKLLPIKMGEWRKAAESTGHSRSREWADQFALMHQGCLAVAPILASALAAVDSEIEQVSDQSGLLDDLMTFSEWQLSGTTDIIEAPALVAYVYHHALGALLIQSNRHAEAIRLLRKKLPISVGPNSQYRNEIRFNSSLMGWTESLGHNVKTGWQFLKEVWDHQPWLSHFFVDSKEFNSCLRGYVALAAILELAFRVKSLASEGMPQEWPTSRVPTIFFSPVTDGMRHVTVETFVELAIPNRQVLEMVAEEGECSAADLRKVWPVAFQRMRTDYSELFGDPFMRLSNGQEVPPLP